MSDEPTPARPPLDGDRLVAGIESGDRTALAQAITLVESRRDSDIRSAQRLLRALLPRTGASIRVGITGVPGVGKSTFIETLGLRLVEQGRRVGVLAVDPSSKISGGSILGDKSRMTRLAQDERAFIRPSPAGDSLGGVARRTRDGILLCEAAGFDVILIETVGVGQSETTVADMVDFFLVLMLPGAGDELQGIKKGIIELADMLAVNKADGDNEVRAREAVQEYSAALRYLTPRGDGWRPRAMAVSAKTGVGVDELWAAVVEHHELLAASGELDRRRESQRGRWMWHVIETELGRAFRAHPAVREQLTEVEAALADGRLTPTEAALRLIDAFRT